MRKELFLSIGRKFTRWLYFTPLMRTIKIARLIWTFYKSFLFSSIVITACCLELFQKYGFSIFVALFWLKIATLILTYNFINKSKKNEYYYYLNLGVTKLLLWVITLGFDFILFLVLIIQTHKIHEP